MEKAKRNYSLDFLKILATIAIVFHHYQQLTGARFDSFINFFGDWFYWGYLVEFFFLLSGYFMYRYIPAITEGAVTLADWWKKRAVRLLPMVAVSAVCFELILLGYLKLYGIAWQDIDISIWGMVLTSLGIQMGWGFTNPFVNNPVWYISVLMLCYVLFYIVTTLAARLKCKPAYLYIAMILVGIGVITYGTDAPFLTWETGRGYYAFFFGVLLSGYVKKYGVGIKETVASVVCLVFFASVFLFFPKQRELNLCYTLTFLVFPSMVLLFESKPVQKLFCHKFWGTVSAISFEVYLWHTPLVPVLYMLMKWCNWNPNLSKVGSMLLFTAAVWVVGTAMYFLVERPVTKLFVRKGEKALEK